MDGIPFPEEQLMNRFFTDLSRDSGNDLYLTAEDARHALSVLRLKPGNHIGIIREGSLWEAEIIRTDSRDVCVRLVSPLPSTEPALSVTLFQGLPKADKMDLIVQKATELGVAHIVPVITRRCVVKTDASDISRKLERWNRISREAGKQSGRCVIPDVSLPVPLEDLSHDPHLAETNIVPWEEADHYGPLSFRGDYPSLSSLGILIGPEGGLEKEEISCLRSSGFIPLTLGKRILRTETAGPAAIAAMMSLYGEME